VTDLALATKNSEPIDLQNGDFEKFQDITHEIKKKKYDEAREIVRSMKEKIASAKSELDGISAIAQLFLDENFLVLFKQMVSKLEDVADEMIKGKFEVKNYQFVMQELDHTPSWEEFESLYEKVVAQLRIFCKNG